MCYKFRMSRTRARRAAPEPEPEPKPNAEAFWAQFGLALDACAEIGDDDIAADNLVRFLEPHREVWSAIVASMRASADRRAMIERACVLLAERKSDDGLAS
jgi:hypothetical protein